jgi:hypothetical protein
MSNKRHILKQLLKGTITPDQFQEHLKSLLPLTIVIQWDENSYSVPGYLGTRLGHITTYLTKEQMLEVTKGQARKMVSFYTYDG